MSGTPSGNAETDRGPREEAGGTQSFTLDGDAGVAGRRASAALARGDRAQAPPSRIAGFSAGRPAPAATVRSRVRALTRIGRDLTRLTDRRRC